MKNSKKITLFIVLSILLTACFILPAILIDPYNVFHPFNIKNNGIEPNNSYIKMYKVMKQPEKYDAFIFGSSLAGALDSNLIPGVDSCLNMTHSGGLPVEHLANIKTMLANNVHPKLIVLGLEQISYCDAPENRYEDPMRCPYEYSKTNPIDFWKIYFNPEMLIKSIPVIENAKRAQNTVTLETFLNQDTNTEIYEKNEIIRKENFLLAKQSETRVQKAVDSGNIHYGLYAYMDDALDAVKEISDICARNNIELVVYISPVFFEVYEKAVTEQSFLEFLDSLSEIVPYYNFSGYNHVTTDATLYMSDRVHYGGKVGDKMIDIMFYGSKPTDGFGKYVARKA